jgi:hypothetical protein
MTAKVPGEDNRFNKTTTPFHRNISNTGTPSLDSYAIIIIIICVVVLVLVIAFFIAALVCYKRKYRCRNSGNPHRQLNLSEGRDFYENYRLISGRRAGDSLETIVNPPLRHPPDMNIQSGSIPAIHEDDYETPRQGNLFWHRRRKEIEDLPPAPPVFPGDLDLLPLEGAYTPVISEDATPLLPPSPMHGVTYNPELREHNEEPGYEVPNSPTRIFLQQNVTETDHSQVPRKIKHKGSEYQFTARAVVTPRGEEKESSSTSNRRSFSESASGSSGTQNETENTNDSKGKKYRSACQLYLSPTTQHRRPPVPTRKPTVVVCIHAEI